MRLLSMLTGVLLATFATATATASTPKAQAQSLDSQAIALLGAQHDDTAAVKIRMACRLDPFWSESWGLRAVLAFRQHRLATSYKYLLKAIALRPHDPAELNNLAVLAQAQNHPLHACTYYLKALAAHPGGHQLYDNICSQLNCMGTNRSLRFRTLQAAYVVTDKLLQKRMAAKGLIRYGATWVSNTQQQSVHKITRRFINFENSLVAQYLADLKKLHHINTQGRTNEQRIAALVRLSNSNAWNNPVNVEHQQLFAAQIKRNQLLAARAAVLRHMAKVRRRNRNLLHTPVGRIFCAPLKMILPDPASSTETPQNNFPASLKHLDSSPVAAYSLIMLADHQIIAQIKHQIHSDRTLGDKKDLALQTRSLQIAKHRLKVDIINARGPEVHFLGATDHAVKIVYIVDHEGCLRHTYGFLRRQLAASIHQLHHAQQFAVIVFCRHYHFAGPRRLVTATARNKRRCLKLLRGVRPMASPGRQLQYFTRPFKAALRLHPQTIFFLTGSGCGPPLAKDVQQLNKKLQAHIFTYTLIPPGNKDASTIQMMAQENGGQYRNLVPDDIGN